MDFRSTTHQEDGGTTMGCYNNPPPPQQQQQQQQPPVPVRVSAFSKPDPTVILPLTAVSTLQTTTPPPMGAGGGYKECLRNHAASLGGHVLDGCGEYMPTDDTQDDSSMKCAACGCHRSFHRRDTEPSSSYYRHHHHHRNNTMMPPVPLLLPPPHPNNSSSYKQHIIMPFPPSPSGVAAGNNNSGSGATTESSSEDRAEGFMATPNQMQQQSTQMQMVANLAMSSKKRYRTKFTAEQKEKMLAFAESVGWRFHKQDEAAVENFCREVGVRRQVLKVWMHNNKHSIKKQQQEMQMQMQQQQQHGQLQPQQQQQLEM